MNPNDFVDVIDQSMVLNSKARAVDTMLWEKCRSPENLLYSFVVPHEWRRVTIEEPASTAPDPGALAPADLKYGDASLEVRQVDGKPQYLLQGIPLEDVEAYEDTLMATGHYLSALSFQYLATSDPAVLERAHVVAEALYSVYELGLEDQPGWIPKPYGFRCSKQASGDNQCPMGLGLIRYYRIACDEHRRKIIKLLTDLMDYWIRHNYVPHHSYFGLEMTIESIEQDYPGHWPLQFLPLCYAVWKLTGESKYKQQYDFLVSKVNMDATADADFVTFTVGCQWRWYYQLGGMLELNTPDRYQWRKGLSNTLRSLEMRAWKHGDQHFSADMYHHRATWLTHSPEDLETTQRLLLVGRLADLQYIWPADYRPEPTLVWRDRCIYTSKPAQWLETYWKGRSFGHFD